MNEKILVDINVVNEAMYAIRKLQEALGIELPDEEGFGYVYNALEKALIEAEA